MTLDPAATVEAWCHQRGYVCFIQELHGRKVKAGETFGAAYIVGYFDDVADMSKRMIAIVERRRFSSKESGFCSSRKSPHNRAMPENENLNLLFG